MKEILKESFKRLVADRYLFLLLTFLILLAITFSIIIAFSIHPSELQLVSHFSAFGVTRWYRDQWFYLFVFSAFELIVAGLHSVISVKLLITKGRPLAVMFAWYGIAIEVLGLVTAISVIKSWMP
jgi:hypothetical protein